MSRRIGGEELGKHSPLGVERVLCRPFNQAAQIINHALQASEVRLGRQLIASESSATTHTATAALAWGRWMIAAGALLLLPLDEVLQAPGQSSAVGNRLDESRLIGAVSLVDRQGRDPIVAGELLDESPDLALELLGNLRLLAGEKTATRGGSHLLTSLVQADAAGAVLAANPISAVGEAADQLG